MILLYPIGDDNDTVVSYWRRYQMHIESCLERIAYIGIVMFDYVLGDYVHWWTLVIYVLGEFLCLCDDVEMYLLEYYACMFDDWICWGVVMNVFY